jgi:hypothetical protein
LAVVKALQKYALSLLGWSAVLRTATKTKVLEKYASENTVVPVLLKKKFHNPTLWGKVLLEMLKAHYTVNKNLPPDPSLKKNNAVTYSHPISLIPILTFSSHIRLGLPCGLLTSGFLKSFV